MKITTDSRSPFYGPAAYSGQDDDEWDGIWCNIHSPAPVCVHACVGLLLLLVVDAI
jgi:hypothetical protein